MLRGIGSVQRHNAVQKSGRGIVETDSRAHLGERLGRKRCCATLDHGTCPMG